jgi:hypothetical protein
MSSMYQTSPGIPQEDDQQKRSFSSHIYMANLGYLQTTEFLTDFHVVKPKNKTYSLRDTSH